MESRPFERPVLGNGLLHTSWAVVTPLLDQKKPRNTPLWCSSSGGGGGCPSASVPTSPNWAHYADRLVVSAARS